MFFHLEENTRTSVGEDSMMKSSNSAVNWAVCGRYLCLPLLVMYGRRRRFGSKIRSGDVRGKWSTCDILVRRAFHRASMGLAPVSVPWYTGAWSVPWKRA